MFTNLTHHQSTAAAHRPIDPHTVRVIRRGGALLLASFLSFVAFFATIILFRSEADAEQQKIAEARGVNINDLPAEVIAPILREHQSPILAHLLILVLVVACSLLFAYGVWTLNGVGGSHREPLAVVATVLAGLATLAFPFVMFMEAMITRARPPAWALDLWDTFYNPTISAFGTLESVALICAVLCLRSTSYARRTGIVVMVLSGLCVVAAATGGSPPIVPLLLGAVLGFVLIRGARSRA